MNYILILFWFLVNFSHSQYPYISYNGETLPNHDLLRYRWGYSIRLRCHTDLLSCCNETFGGTWYTPSQSIYNPLNQYNGNMFVELDGHIDTSGIYECRIPTFNNRQGESVYVGLYRSGGIYCNNNYTIIIISEDS